MTLATPVTDVKEKQKTTSKIKKPGKYQIIFHNDDVTPMQYVIAILHKVFNYGEEDAYNITMKIHNEGRAVVGIFIKEIATMKKRTVDEYNQSNGYTLKCTLEPVEE